MGQTLNKKELCEYFGRNPKTVTKMIRSEGFPKQICPGYWSKAQVNRWLVSYKHVDQNFVIQKAEEILNAAVDSKRQ